MRLVEEIESTALQLSLSLWVAKKAKAGLMYLTRT